MHRERLVDLVGSDAIVLIEGPAGSGKTLLAEDLLARWVNALDGVEPQRSHPPSIVLPVDPSRPWFIDDAEAVAIEEAVDLVSAVERHRAPVVIAGRRTDAFAPLRHRSDVRLIGRTDLSFTVDDLAAELGGEAPATLVADLLTASAGWATVIDRALQRIAVDPHWSPSGANGANVLIRDAVGDIASLTPVLRLPIVDDAMVAPDILGRLPLHRVGRWWSVPSVVRAALGPIPELSIDELVAAGRRYLGHGEVTVAADLMVDAADSDATVRVFDGVSSTTLASLETWRLRQLVASVRPAAASAPFLHEAARAAERADTDSWGAWLQLASEVADTGPLARAIAVDLARHRNRTGDFAGSSADAMALLAEIPADEPDTRARALVVIAMSEVYECTAASLASAIDRYREACALFRRTQSWSARSEALERLGYQALFMAGRPIDGELAMQEGLALLPAGDWVRAYWLTHHSDLLDFLGRSVEAEAAAAEAIEIGERSGDDVLIGMGWWQRSWMASHRRDRRGFRTAIEMVERHRGTWLTESQEVVFLASTAERFLFVDDVEGYETTIARAAEVAEATGLREPVDIARVWFDATHGDADEAVRRLDEMEETPGVVPVYRPRRLALRAVALARRGDFEGARSALGEANQVAASLGVPDLLPRHHVALLDQLSSLLGEDRADSPAVNVRLLGRFAVDGSEPGNSTPQPGHPATLVKLLALTGSMTTESAIDRLWPDVDVATGRARLRNLLNRLKQQAGPLVLRDAETLRLADDVVVDVSVFEHAATAAMTASAEERVGRARHALALYTGDLLPGDAYEDWASGHRERLRRRVVTLADIVGADAEARHDLDEAIHWFDLALEIEPLDELRTIHLCEMLVTGGRAASARRLAQRGVAVLADFGVRPSIALESFASGER